MLDCFNAEILHGWRPAGRDSALWNVCDLDAQFASLFIQSAYRQALESLGVKEANVALGAAGQIVEMVQSVIMSLAGHPVTLLPSKAAYIPKGGTYAPPAWQSARALSRYQKGPGVRAWVAFASSRGSGAA